MPFYRGLRIIYSKQLVFLNLDMQCGCGFIIQQIGPIEIPEEDNALLRIDFIREVDELLLELEAEAQIKPLSGFDAESVAVRLRQQEKLRAIQQVKDLRNFAATLKW